jgi:hypothetical protein
VTCGSGGILSALSKGWYGVVILHFDEVRMTCGLEDTRSAPRSAPPMAMKSHNIPKELVTLTGEQYMLFESPTAGRAQ